MSFRWGVVAACVLGLWACGDDPAEAESTCMTDADCEQVGAGFVCQMGRCVAPEATGSDTDESSSSGEPSEMTSSTTSGEPTPDPTGDPETTEDPDANRCDPDGAPFLLGDDKILRSSIGLNFGPRTCGAASGESDAPQILFEVRQLTGLVDATAFGVELGESSHGQVFDEPPAGDSQAIDLPIELDITLTGTTIPDGTPISIQFRFSELGPSLMDCEVEYG